MIFTIIAAVVLKMRILWQLKWESTLEKQPPIGVLEIRVWQLLLKLFKNVYEGSSFQKSWNNRIFRYISRVFISVAKHYVMLPTSFSLKQLLKTAGKFWTYCGQSFAGLCLFLEVKYMISNISVVKTLLYIFLTVKAE